jgi:hypothetical protein
LDAELDGLGLAAEQRKEVEAQLRTVEAQAESPKPKTSIADRGSIIRLISARPVTRRRRDYEEAE